MPSPETRRADDERTSTDGAERSRVAKGAFFDEGGAPSIALQAFAEKPLPRETASTLREGRAWMGERSDMSGTRKMDMRTGIA